MRWAGMMVLVVAGCAPAAEEEPVGAVAGAVQEAPEAYYVVLPSPPAAALLPPGSDLGAPDTVRRVRRHLADLAHERDALRPRLLAEGATIVTELSRVVHAFHVMMTPTAARRVRRMAGVSRVEPVPVFERHLGSALPLVGAPQAWGVPLTGQGIRLGIIDSGIDYLHAGFGGSGDPAAYGANDRDVIEPGSFPTARVVGGWDFAGDDYDASGGSINPSPDPDPLDCGGHGSHVAGIAAGGGVLVNGNAYAGPYSQSFVPSAFRVAPGVAPEAELYAIKIFGCGGSTQLFVSGLEWAADPDQDGDMSDRLDVVNASLGTSYGLASPVTDSAVEALTALGTLVVAAAGNEGATFFVLSSPARVPSVLSVAASVDSGLVNLDVTAPSSIAGTMAAAEAAFSPSLAGLGTVSGELAAADPILACGSLANDLSGKIAFIQRGACSFLEKFAHAEAAGAIAVVVANDAFDEGPFAMQGSGSSNVPGVMVSAVDGQTLSAATGVEVTLTAAPYDGAGAEVIAGLSSRGPGTEVQLKPEIAAPGLQVASVAVGSGNQPTDKSGTSMAAPFVAGAAALVRQAFPSLGPGEVKAALMNSARPIENAAGAIFPTTMQGTGRLDVAAAVTQSITLADADAPDAVGVSFGAFVVSGAVETSRTVRVQNHGSESERLTFTAAQIHPLPGVTVTATPASVDLAPGAEATVTLTLAIEPEVLGDPGLDPVTAPLQFDLPRHALTEADGELVVGGTAAARLPFYAVVRAAGEQRLGAATSCSETRRVGLEGDSAHPRPIVSAFELGVEDQANALEDPRLDLRAIGAASNAGSQSFDETTLFFALAVEGAWSTVAIAGLPMVGIEVDVDDDEDADFLIVPEPLGHEPPHADVLTATTYDLSGCNGFNLDQCEQVERKRYLNGLPADVAPTHPFFNGALVLPVYASDLGLSEDGARVNYRGVSRTITGTVEQTQWASFDALAPTLDTTGGGIREGFPIFEDAVTVRGSGRLLVIHHANVRGKHWEVVEVDALGGAPLTLDVATPATVAANERLEVTVSLDNGGEAALSDLTVEVSVTGGIVAAVSAPGASCDGTTCVFDTLPAGTEEAITLEVVATEAVAVEATVTTGEGCSETRSAEIALATPTPPPPALVPGGGCGCRLGARPAPSLGWLLLPLVVVSRRLTGRGRSRRAG